MTVRRINYTGRKRVSQNDAKVSLLESGNRVAEFDVELSLSEYGLPADALVFIEAHRQTSRMRFPYGTVTGIRPPANRKLHEFDSTEGILFRVLITSVAAPEGMLLAEADRIHPRRPEEVEDKRIPLLPAKPDDNLGEQVFRLDFSDRPMLLINSQVGDWRSVARVPVFVALVLPAAFQEILTRILHVEHHFDSEDMSDWKSQWLKFAARLPGVPDLPSDDEEDRVDDWIGEAVAAFCRSFSIYRKFGQYWTGEASL